VIGGDLAVPLVSGEVVRYVNLDYAATAPCLTAVAAAVMDALPWYGSVHRGAGFASAVMTEALDRARATVAAFVGARDDDVVVFTRNTTDALNLLAAALPAETTVVTYASEHHANLLAWRRGRRVVLPVPSTPGEAIDNADRALAALRGEPSVLSVTGASNVTGERWPLAALGEIAWRHRARLVVDAAQLAPHRAIEMASIGADYVALSGHKLYAPFGCGALVGKRDWLDAAEPYLAGGGAVNRVTLEETIWSTGTRRHEAGTPNVLGAIALAAACRTLANAGMSNIAAREALLHARLLRGLETFREVEVLSLWAGRAPSIGVTAFTVRGWNASALAAALSAEHGVGLRDGAFCAHPLIESLGVPGALRASLGVGTTEADVDRLLRALSTLLTEGPRWRYRVRGGRYVPDPDPRPRPSIVPDVSLMPFAPPSIGDPGLLRSRRL
jgi:selenocysteine lyase/cysteine desulfurase